MHAIFVNHLRRRHVAHIGDGSSLPSVVCARPSAFDAADRRRSTRQAGAPLITAFCAAIDLHNRRMSYDHGPHYLWEQPHWPAWRFDAAALAVPLARVHRAQGHLRGRMAELGMTHREQTTLQVLTEDVVKTSEIEGEQFITRRCGAAGYRGCDTYGTELSA